MSKNIAVILAGGTGTRFGQEFPKQFAKVAGKYIIEHTVEIFQRHQDIDSIYIISKADYIDKVLSLAKVNGWSKVEKVLNGGEDRFGSTWVALQSLAGSCPVDAKILFHDAVRPFIKPSVITNCISKLDDFPAVDVVIDTADTIVEVGDDNCISSIPIRSNLRRGQTPQGFVLGALKKAYEKANEQHRRNFTCDCGVFLEMMPDEKIALVEGDETNMKVTHSADIFLADKLFQNWGDAEGVLHESIDLERKLRGRSLVVFGGSYGIGNAILKKAGECGANTYSFSRSTTGTDVSDSDAVTKALKQVHNDVGRIDFVVNTAAILIRKALSNSTHEEIASVVNINLNGAINVALAAQPYLKESRGGLLFFTSSSNTRGRAFYSIYSATKSAVVNLSQALAEEWGDDGIRVNCINPERTKTPMRTANFGHEPDSTLLSPEKVANLSLRTLVSSTTGHLIDVRR